MQTQALVDEAEQSRPLSPRGARQPLTLRANFAWTFAGNVIYSGCQWGMLVVLARLGDTEMVGRFALGLAITAPVFMFSNLQLRGVQATDARHEFRFGDYLGARLLMSALALLGIGGLVVLCGYGWEVGAVILAVAAAKACETISDIVSGLLQQHECMDRAAVSMVLRGALGLLFLSTALWLTHRLLWGVLGLFAAWSVVLAVYDCRSVLLVGGTRGDRWQTMCPRWRPATLGRLLWLTLPLGIVTCLISLNTNIPRYYVEHYLGLRTLGVFSALGYLMLAGHTVISALAQSASPRLAAYYASGRLSAYRRFLAKLLGMGALLGVVGVLAAVLAGPLLLRLIYGPDYASPQAVALFVLLMIAAGLSYLSSFLDYAATAARYFRIQTPVFLGSSLVSVAASALLVPTAGLRGAGWAAVIAMAWQVLLLGTIVGVIAFRRDSERVLPSNGDTEPRE